MYAPLTTCSNSAMGDHLSLYRFHRRKAYIYGMEMHLETTLTGNCLTIRLYILDHCIVQAKPTDVSIFLSIDFVNREEGDLGPIYGFQWRHFGARYTNMHADYSDQGFDQLLDVIDKIKNRPDDRRIILSVWYPMDLKLMALAPCHMFAKILRINPEKKDIDSSVAFDFELTGYDPHQKIEMKMAV